MVGGVRQDHRPLYPMVVASAIGRLGGWKVKGERRMLAAVEECGRNVMGSEMHLASTNCAREGLLLYVRATLRLYIYIYNYIPSARSHPKLKL